MKDEKKEQKEKEKEMATMITKKVNLSSPYPTSNPIYPTFSPSKSYHRFFRTNLHPKDAAVRKEENRKIIIITIRPSLKEWYFVYPLLPAKKIRPLCKKRSNRKGEIHRRALQRRLPTYYRIMPAYRRKRRTLSSPRYRFLYILEILYSTPFGY